MANKDFDFLRKVLIVHQLPFQSDTEKDLLPILVLRHNTFRTVLETLKGYYKKVTYEKIV